MVEGLLEAIFRDDVYGECSVGKRHVDALTRFLCLSESGAEFFYSGLDSWLESAGSCPGEVAGYHVATLAVQVMGYGAERAASSTCTSSLEHEMDNF